MVRTDRGQLLLIGAVLIGLTILGTVVMLNGMQYADATGTQTEYRVLDDAERTEEMVERDVGRLTNQILAKNPDPGNAFTYVESNVTTYHNYTRNMTLDGSSGTVNVTYNDSVTRGHQGYRIQQTTSQPFAPGTPHLVVDDVEYVRSFVLRIDSFSAPGRTNSFDVVARNATTGETWKLEAYEYPPTPAARVTVTTADGSVTHCDTDAAPELDLVQGTNESGECSFPGVREDIGTPSSFRFEGDDDVEGTYRALVEGNPRVAADDYPVRPGVTVRYRSAELSYNRTILVEDPEAPR
ncbi:hypothetical protein OB920_01260 [Halobacteria archaeon HArc-gm2]|nr:hypothetical protein [Halobacteria archaeon HArc-gm2]